MPPSNTLSPSSSYRSQKATAASLSLFEKLDTVTGNLTILANAFAAIFTQFFRSKDQKPDTFYKYIALTVIRTLTRRLSVRQQHYILPPTDDAYIVACKKRGVEPHSLVLEDGTRAHWIGEEGAEKLIVNFHGGGYVVPASPEMFEFQFQLIELLNSRTHSSQASKSGKVAALFLSYDLAPRAPYPRQLSQATNLLSYVLTKLSIPPSNIILMGDSAGANLALSLLSHITHPHPSPSVPRLSLPPGSKFCGAVLISPWVDFSTSDPIFEEKKYKDCLGPKALEQWSSAFLGGGKIARDNYNQPVLAGKEWWRDFPVERVLVVAGGDELLIDGIRRWEKVFCEGFEGEDEDKEGGNGKVEFLVVEGEFHDHINVGLGMGVGGGRASEEG